MPKNIVVRCDDPANEFARDHSNVVRPYNALEHEEATQVTYHHPGLGTTEPEGAQFLVRTLIAVGGIHSLYSSSRHENGGENSGHQHGGQIRHCQCDHLWWSEGSKRSGM
jgi:hypothetical protein